MMRLNRCRGIAVLLGLWTVAVSAGMVAAGEGLVRPVRFAVIGDRTGSPVNGIYGEVVKEIERMRPEFVMTVGDMIEVFSENHEEIEAAWNEYFKLIEPLSMPVYFTPGNNDIESDMHEYVYHSKAGTRFYSLDYEGIHFVVLDNSRWDDFTKWPAEESEWLINDLRDNEGAAYTLVFMHRPDWYTGVAAGETDILHSLFRVRGVDAVFTGHYHEYFSGTYDGIMYTGVGSSGGGAEVGPSGVLYHFCWVTIDDDGIHIAPIKKDAVLPWDEVTADQRRLVGKMKRWGCAFAPFPVIDVDKIEGPLTLTVNNLSGENALIDTLTWSLPPGWRVTPEVMSVDIPPGESRTVAFEALCSGELYPAPAVSLDFAFDGRRKTEIVTPIRVCRKAEGRRADELPLINGRLTESVWEKPVTAMFAPGGGTSTVEPTEFYFAYDDTVLYLAARCTESRMDSLAGRQAGRDGPVYGEDCVGYFLQPPGDSTVAYQIYFGAGGGVFDQKLVADADGYMSGDIDWNGRYTIKTYRGDGFWSVEVAVPLNQFGITASAGDEWSLNFRRKQSRIKSAADWQTPIEYHPSTFGVLVLK